jgi:hypothetical protein
MTPLIFFIGAILFAAVGLVAVAWAFRGGAGRGTK